MTAHQVITKEKPMSAKIEDTKWYSYTSSTQTMRTWARRIDTLADVPAEFQAAFPRSVDPFPYTVYLPENKTPQASQQEPQIICLFPDHFILLEQRHGEVHSHTADLAEVVYLQRGLILLNSWLQIGTRAGVFDLYFNTAVDYLFKPITEGLRQETFALAGEGAPRTAKPGPDRSQFDFLDRANYKFMNYGRSSIPPNDDVLSLIYEPEHTLRAVRLFDKTIYRQYQTAQLAIVTDRELIIIQEEKRIRNNFDPTHGGVFTYIPRRHLQAVTFASQPQPPYPHYVMDVSLPGDLHLTAEFSAANKELASFQALWG